MNLHIPCCWWLFLSCVLCSRTGGKLVACIIFRNLRDINLPKLPGNRPVNLFITHISALFPRWYLKRELLGGCPKFMSSCAIKEDGDAQHARSWRRRWSLTGFKKNQNPSTSLPALMMAGMQAPGGIISFGDMMMLIRFNLLHTGSFQAHWENWTTSREAVKLSLLLLWRVNSQKCLTS